MALAPWSQRIQQVQGPQKMDILDYAHNVPIGNASPSVVRVMIENTPGNTPLNNAQGGLFELPGRYNDSSQWRDNWFKGSQANYSGMEYGR